MEKYIAKIISAAPIRRSIRYRGIPPNAGRRLTLMPSIVVERGREYAE